MKKIVYIVLMMMGLFVNAEAFPQSPMTNSMDSRDNSVENYSSNIFDNETQFLEQGQIPPMSTFDVPGGQGGLGGDGFGTTVPIDTHVYALVIVALLFIVFYTRQTTAQKTN